MGPLEASARAQSNPPNAHPSINPLLIIKNRGLSAKCMYVCTTVVGDDSLESALRDEETLCMDMVYDALDWYKKAVIETREIEVRLKCIQFRFCLLTVTVIVDAVVISSPM